MSNIRGVIVEKGSVGASVENLDGVSALLINAPAIEVATGITGIVNGEVYLFEKLKDAEDHGINAAYDVDNDVRVYRHISEFYRMAGEGTKLYFMAALVTKDMADMITDHGHALVAGADGEIRYLAVGYSPQSDYTPIYVDGLEDIVREAIPLAQTLHDWSFETDRPLNVVIEGRGINGLAASYLDLRGIEISDVVIPYNNVSICIGQDWNFAEALEGNSKTYADIGTMLGTRARIQVNYNIGEVGEEGDVNNLDLSDTKRLVWLTAGLSDHTKIIAREDDLQTINDKGYIFAISYTGISGYRWNDDHVCAPIIIDADDNMNVHTIALGAAQNKLARLIRQYLLPKVKSTVPVDTSTGKLTTGMVKYFEGIANQAFYEMLANGEISGGEAIVDPDSDLLTGDKQLTVSFTMVSTGTIGQIRGTINIKKTL
ncbi:MAG: hypothetical protein IMY72_11755 [Bacteroidetes bacterium]|nr:hypothetical protein [Bacteroidota bacterium]